MTDKQYELLVHTRAPLARNEALYRSLASAYLEFTEEESPEPQPEDEADQQSYVVQQHASMPGTNAESQSQQPEHDTLQAFMSPSGAESWRPDSELESLPEKSYLTRSRLATSSAAPQATPPASLPPTSQASFMSTFPSMLDGMNSPRFRMPALVPGNEDVYQWPKHTQSSRAAESITKSFDGTSLATPQLPRVAQGQLEDSSRVSGFLAPPSTVQDSQSPLRRPAMTSQLVMESFLAHFDSHTATSMSSPSVRRSQTQRSHMTSASTNTVERYGSSLPQAGQMPADSSFGSNQSSFRPRLVGYGRPAPQISPPKPRRKRQGSPSNAQSIASQSLRPASQINSQASHQKSQALSAADRVIPAPPHGDEEPVDTYATPANANLHHDADSTALQKDTRPAPLPILSHMAPTVTATPTPPGTPARELKKRRATNTSLEDSPSRPAKKAVTAASRPKEAFEVLQTPKSTANGVKNAAPQIPFTGSFNLPTVPAHQLSRVANASFDENMTRISDTPRAAPPRSKLSTSKLANGAPKPPLQLNTSISVVPDTPTPAPVPAPRPAPAPPSSSALPLPSAPPSSVVTATKPLKPKKSSTRPLSSYEIHPPPPLASDGPLTTFITPFLTKIANQMSSSRYDPASTARSLRKDERGYWSISLPDDVGGWNEKLREETWKYLEKIVAKGRAGWGVHMYRALWNGTEKEAEWKGEEWRVYCWGEIAGQVYLLLFLASSRRVRGLGATWVDGGGDVVVKMGSERRVKETIR